MLSGLSLQDAQPKPLDASELNGDSAHANSASHKREIHAHDCAKCTWAYIQSSKAQPLAYQLP